MSGETRKSHGICKMDISRPGKVLEKKKKSPKFGKGMKFVIFIVLNNEYA